MNPAPRIRAMRRAVRRAMLVGGLAGLGLVACARGPRSEHAAGASTSGADSATSPGTETLPASPAGGAVGPPAAANPPVRDHGVPAAGHDTLRGTVSITGSEPMSSVVVTPRQGEAVIVQGAPAVVLRNADGLEVRLDGRRTGARAVGAGARPSPVFEATSFIVRALDGQPAIDGVLERTANGFLLRTMDGRARAVAALPDGLREHVGARVYLVGPPDVAPSAYGVLVPRR